MEQKIDTYPSWLIPLLQVIMIVVICTSLAVVVCYSIPHQARSQYEKAMCDCQKLKLGMTIEEVKPIISKIKSISKYPKSFGQIEIWSFDTPTMPPEPVIGFVDITDSVLIGYQCGDSGSATLGFDFILTHGYDSLNNVLTKLSSVRPGLSPDCVTGLLGAPRKELIDSSGMTWVYNARWRDAQELQISFDSSGSVLDTDIDLDIFVIRERKPSTTLVTR